MNSEIVYWFLMGMGWFFLAGWLIALLVACASVFWPDRSVQFAGVSSQVPVGKLTAQQSGEA